ncbi:patatin-domain-containing protein [Aulographum hederae CBS 113979]|uniref:Patatin-like phospholipase domain-containing protein n=1 Tax=Aulographum hederae CBS 113979 TaxID=1176131 RepID=A0A6G1HAG5_9PEZI|nr:patatin-domain-containing protein [Aulographum hederae CBS 113979]
MFFNDAVLPRTASLHQGLEVPIVGADGHIQPLRRLRKAQSHAGLLSPLVKLVQHPIDLVDSALGSWNLEENPPVKSVAEDEEAMRQALYARMNNAETYDEWHDSAIALDELEGNEAWKLEADSNEYDHALVAARLAHLDDARKRQNVSRMLFLIRTSLTRGLGGMGDLKLYKHSHVGTKKLIERYITSTKETLEMLLQLSTMDQGLDSRHVLEQLLATRQAFGRSALLLSGGGTFGMNHIGVVKCLWQNRLLPRIISGSSAGSIVCAVLCTKNDSEIPDTLEEFCYGDLAVFEKEGEEEGVLRKAARFLKFGALFDISNLVRVMRNMLGDITFQEAYNRTRRILNICVSSEGQYELPRLLNYITAPNVMIWSAVAASCSVPLIYSAAALFAKDPKTGKQVPWNPSPQRWIDGSVDNDLPMTRLAEMFNVNHFIVSQVNPHVVPFLAKEEGLAAADAHRNRAAVDAGPTWLHTMANLAKEEALHRLHVLTDMGIFPNYLSKARSVLSQRYSGDITILPEVAYANFPRVLQNPTTEFMLNAMYAGERATWPKLSRIQNHCAIELALDDAVQRLRARVVFSPSQVDLRMSNYERARTSVRPMSAHGRGRARNNPHFSFPATPLLKTRASSYYDRNRVRKSAHSNPQTAYLKISAADVASSADDDQDNKSDIVSSSDGEESTFSSDSPPPSPFSNSPHPHLWPSTRQLFPSASQPATPFYSHPLGMTPSTSKTAVAANTSAVRNSLDGTIKRSEPSSPELRYKRLFHGPIREPAPAEKADPNKASQNLSVPPEMGRGRRGSKGFAAGIAPLTSPGSTMKQPPGGLQLDISGTRGMMRRRKRSLSTGLKGLWPPSSAR